ncbi:MAG: DUF951 domain-containing protein [Peptoniphilaceae bacterium]|nr:DUF951 domain-containing protein [Peptoniphilaceae bacterium]MDY6086142.1 DUF951 domain-containing protein [Peptoniphilaceae bacterium]
MAKVGVGSVVQLKKPHACGTNEWTVKRTGIDYRLICSGCGQELWMKRPEFQKRLRRIRQADGRFVAVVNAPDWEAPPDAQA